MRYEQHKKRRDHKKAILAIAHMLLNCIYHMLSKNEPFDYKLYRVETASRPKPLPIFTPQQAIFLLEGLGAQIILPAGI